MHAEIIAIGNELLLGRIVDTNSAAISKKLQSIGLPLHYTQTVGDDLGRMVAAIRQGLARSKLVITTGGLGPTVDDLTREAISQAMERPLVFDEELLRQIEARFLKLGRTMTANNRLQAYRPEGSIPIENPVGTAPCFIVEQDGRALVCLPGVPREMEYLMDNAVLPFLRKRYGLKGIIKSRELKVAGSGESLVDERIGEFEMLANPTVGLNAGAGIIIIRITATARDEKEADGLIEPVEAAIRERLGNLVFGADADTLETIVLEQLSSRCERIAVVECGTGGRLSGRLAEADSGAFTVGKIKPRAGADNLIELARQSALEASADWGLACIVENTDGNFELGIGLWSQGQSDQWRRGFASHPSLIPEWASSLALNALRTALAVASP